jgi:hypothetical protein
LEDEKAPHREEIGLYPESASFDLHKPPAEVMENMKQDGDVPDDDKTFV